MNKDYLALARALYGLTVEELSDKLALIVEGSELRAAKKEREAFFSNSGIQCTCGRPHQDFCGYNFKKENS